MKQNQLSHEMLYALAVKACAFQRNNDKTERKVFAKGKLGQDVVTDADLSNERFLRQLLIREISDLSFLYGEENGFERVGDGTIGAVMDPIDGTRCYALGLFYSGISVAFVNLDGETAAGFSITINNQNPGDLGIWTFDGETAEKDGQLFTPEYRVTSIKDAIISVTNVSNFSEELQLKAALIAKEAAGRSRGALSFCSGTMETLMVIEGRLGGFINVCVDDIVSHLVGIEIAKSLGYYVGHVHSSGSSFRVHIDLENGRVEPEGDMSLVVAPEGIEKEIRQLIADAESLTETMKYEMT